MKMIERKVSMTGDSFGEKGNATVKYTAIMESEADLKFVGDFIYTARREAMKKDPSLNGIEFGWQRVQAETFRTLYTMSYSPRFPLSEQNHLEEAPKLKTKAELDALFTEDLELIASFEQDALKMTQLEAKAKELGMGFSGKIQQASPRFRITVSFGECDYQRDVSSARNTIETDDMESVSLPDIRVRQKAAYDLSIRFGDAITLLTEKLGTLKPLINYGRPYADHILREESIVITSCGSKQRYIMPYDSQESFIKAVQALDMEEVKRVIGFDGIQAAQDRNEEEFRQETRKEKSNLKAVKADIKAQWDALIGSYTS